MRFLTFIVLALFSASAHAQDDKPYLDASICQQLTVDYEAPDDINKNADYQPGVDLQGRPVVEADTRPSDVTIPKTVEFNISVLQARYLGLKSSSILKGEAIIGRVAVDTKTGRVSYNGQPIGRGADLDVLRDLCRKDDVTDPSKVDIKNPKGVVDLKNPKAVEDLKNPSGQDIKNPAGVTDLKNPENIDVKTGK